MASATRAPSVKPAEGKPRPYATLADAPKASSESASLDKIQGGVREANRALINTLGKEDNPITNSTAYQRTLHVQVRRPHPPSSSSRRRSPHALRARDGRLRAWDSAESALTTACLLAELLDGPSRRRRARSLVEPDAQRQAHRPGRQRRDQHAQGRHRVHQRLHGCVPSFSSQQESSSASTTRLTLLSRAGDDITNMQLRELVQHQGGKMVYVLLSLAVLALDEPDLTPRLLRPQHGPLGSLHARLHPREPVRQQGAEVPRVEPQERHQARHAAVGHRVREEGQEGLRGAVCGAGLQRGAPSLPPPPPSPALKY